MKFLLYLILMVISSSAFSSDYVCVEDYLDKKVVFAFNDGDVDYLRFFENQYGVVTANYYASGRGVIRKIKVYCLEYPKEIFLTSSEPSTSGPYKKPIKLYLPVDVVSGESEAQIDLRWGEFYVPYQIGRAHV